MAKAIIMWKYSPVVQMLAPRLVGYFILKRPSGAIFSIVLVGNTLGFVLGDEYQEDRWVFQVLNTSYAVSVWLCTFLGPQEILRILKSCH